MKTIAIIGPLDTKGAENAYLKKKIEEQGCGTVVIDIRTLGEPDFTPDISPEEVAAAAGTSVARLLESGDRMLAIQKMGEGAAEITYGLYQRGEIHGVIAMGGAQTSSMVACVMRRLPIGFPKFMVSTIATSGPDQVMLAGVNDTCIINPLVDVGGMNPILSMIIDRAAGAITGMVKAMPADAGGGVRVETDSPCIGITMWGVTTKCALKVAELLRQAGFQPLVFHATGIGGHTMEKLIEDGVIQGVVDLTLAEFSNPILGGDYPYDPMRLTTAGKQGVPQVVIPGGCDMIKHMTENGIVPEEYRGTTYCFHNPSLLFVRSDIPGNQTVGKALAEKLNTATGHVEVLFPEKGVSAYDIEGGPLFDPACDRALAESIRDHLRKDIHFEMVGHHINDEAFAELVAARMICAMEQRN